MSELQWISIITNIFDHQKIRYLENLPEGDRVIVIWFKLLMLAGKCNDSGLVYLTKEIPYQPEMLASVMNRPLNIIQFALDQFVTLRMIEIQDSYIAIANWEKYQQKGIGDVREKARIRQENYRKKQKLLISNVTNNVTVTGLSSSLSSSIVLNPIYGKFLENWNSKARLQKHKPPTVAIYIKPTHERIIKDMGDQLNEAIDNYAKLSEMTETHFFHKWPFWDFIKNAQKYTNDATPFTTYKLKTKSASQKACEPWPEFGEQK